MIPFGKTFTASLYATMAISFWGISFVSTKAVLYKLDPFTLLVMRFGIGALFLFLLLLLTREKFYISIKYVPHLIVLGILGVFVHQVLQATALLTIDASSAGWLISFSPIFTVLLSMIFLHEKMTPSKVIGMILSVLGVLLITSARNGQPLSLTINLGFLLMILSTLNWAIYSILLKGLRIPYPALVVTFYMSLVGFILTSPFLVRNKGWESLKLLSLSEWAHLVFLGIFVSGIAYWYWGKAHEVMAASKVSMFLYLEPLSTLIAAIVILHEKILVHGVLGGIIIIFGVIIVNGQWLPKLIEGFPLFKKNYYK
ncbi:DMT family transporter [Sutcliffiella horikoshii]|uniref:DMT family transporter n=1 Tax=Sutcliffiella horikoshii TaxID=79883 RepID=A0A5D4SW34_9BACI|nr:DMT family transporter [Sutcliffiella horikoshii]TYS67169.1 DMT family transporter [Sutcliffiella horikoshii]